MNNNYVNSINEVSNASKKTLYLFIGIASLFIFLISSTYAYFTASVTNTSTISGSIGSFDISLDVIRIDNDTTRGVNALNGDKLIPIQTTSASTWGGVTYQYGKTLNKALGNSCVDSQNYRVCQVYEVILNVPSTMPLTYLKGSAQIYSDASNLKIASIKQKSTSSTNLTRNLKFVSDGNTTYYNKSYGLTNLKSLPNTSSLLSCDNINNLCFTDITMNSDTNVSNDDNSFDGTQFTTYYYYLIVWLEDTGESQSSIDASHDFNGFVSFTTADGSTQGEITAYFSS